MKYATIYNMFDMALKSNLWPGTTPQEWLKIIFYIHSKGWIHSYSDTIIVAYRIEEINESTLVRIPVTESGDILYVPLVFSTGNDTYKAVRDALREYLDNNPDIKELVLEDKGGKLKRFILKGELNGKLKEARVTSTANAVH